MPKFRHSHRVEGKRDAFPDFFAGHADVLRSERDVVLDDGSHRLIVGVLKDDAYVFAHFEDIFAVAGVYAKHRDFSRRRRQQTVHEPRQSGFSAAVMP